MWYHCGLAILLYIHSPCSRVWPTNSRASAKIHVCYQYYKYVLPARQTNIHVHFRIFEFGVVTLYYIQWLFHPIWFSQELEDTKVPRKQGKDEKSLKHPHVSPEKWEFPAKNVVEAWGGPCIYLLLAPESAFHKFTDLFSWIRDQGNQAKTLVKCLIPCSAARFPVSPIYWVVNLM